MGVHRRMPVVAAVESRMQNLGTPNVGRIIYHVFRLVWVFPDYTSQREAREPRCLRLAEG